MRSFEKFKRDLNGLSVRKRLAYSNVVMFLLPLAIAFIVMCVSLAAAFYVFATVYLPSVGLSLETLHALGERHEAELKPYVFGLIGLILLILAVLVLAIILTDRFLVNFVLRRIEEPLELLADRAARVSEGELDAAVNYDRHDEFYKVCEAFDRMTERLRDSAELASAAEQSRRELFAGVSHDLRSPLTSIRAYTEALLDGIAQSPDDTRRYLEKIYAHELEVEQLVETLFEYTKLQLKDYPVHLETLELRAELERVCRKCNTDHLKPELAEMPPLCISADRLLFERVVLNLLDNSRKYRRGTVAAVQISAQESPEGVSVFFDDDGIGVGDEALAKLFEPFYRADPSRTAASGSSGLGLAIVRSALARMGAEVSAEKSARGGLNVKILFVKADPDGR